MSGRHIDLDCVGHIIFSGEKVMIYHETRGWGCGNININILYIVMSGSYQNAIKKLLEMLL